MDRDSKEYKKEVAKALTSKLNQRIIRKHLREEKRKDKSGKLCKVLIMSLVVIASTGCSLADPAVQGHTGGGDFYQVGIHKDGTVERCVKITSTPNSRDKFGRMYNKSIYSKFADWITQPVVKEVR